MKYETPELLNVGAVEHTVQFSTSGNLWDGGTDLDSSLKINSVLDVD